MHVGFRLPSDFRFDTSRLYDHQLTIVTLWVRLRQVETIPNVVCWRRGIAHRGGF
jgi:hypothetical protein